MDPRSDSSQGQSDLDLHLFVKYAFRNIFLQTTISSLLAVIGALMVSYVSSVYIGHDFHKIRASTTY